MSRDDATLLDLETAARRIRRFVRGMTRAAFLLDLKTQSAVLHQLLIVGEAVKRLSPEFRTAHPEMPWMLMAGMRDKLNHHHEAVNLARVWLTAERDMPALLAFLKSRAPKKTHARQYRKKGTS